MKTKLVLWGTNAQNERMLIGLELRPEVNKVNVYTFPESVATEEFSQLMLKDWRNNDPVEFPEGYELVEKELTITDSLLPEEIKVERGDIVQRAQTEWHFIVLSAKLNDAYRNELSELQTKVEGLARYETSIWDELKTFWDKVQVQVRERNLLKDHANALRDDTNGLFAKMKELRNKLDEEFQRISSENFEKFFGLLEDVEKRVSEGMRLQPIFDELKKLQRNFRDTKFTREHRSKVWEKLDGAFKLVKEKRFGSAASDDKSPMERLMRRYDGLIAAIEKMERSIKRDDDDLEFQNRKIATTDGQLEAQIRQAKIKMIEERIRSKQEKLGEMMQTKSELEKRIEAQKEKDAKRAEREQIEEARKAAQEKIQQGIKAREAELENDSEKLKKAAEAIVKPETEEEEETTEENDGATEENTTLVEEIKNTVEAVATEISENIQEAVETVKEAVEHIVTGDNEEEEATAQPEPVKEEIAEETATEETTDTPATAEEEQPATGEEKKEEE